MTRKGGLDIRVPLSLLVLIVIVGGIALLTLGGSSSSFSKSPPAGPPHFDAAEVLSPPAATPALSLKNYLGQRVNIDSYKGKALLVTFLYTHCPDVCPLIASNLRVAQNLMGPKLAAEAQIITISVDPKGDTPRSVADFLSRHGMTGRMQYLIGSLHELAPVWKAWGVGSERDATHPGFVNHSGLIYGITASGRRITIYASNFQPSEIAHDVPLLAAR